MIDMSAELVTALLMGGILVGVLLGYPLAISVGSVGFMMTDCAWIGYVEPNPGLKKPSALYTLVQSETGMKAKVKKWRDEEREGDYVEVGTKYEAKIVASDCAYIIANTVQ